jgi:hypothetical protein
MDAPRFWNWVPVLLVAGVIGIAHAKLPPPTEAEKAKAEEAKAKAAEVAKKAREQEEKAMDRVAERYKKEKGVKAAAAPTASKKK